VRYAIHRKIDRKSVKEFVKC